MNLALHVLNGWLVFALARRLYRRGAALPGVPQALTQPQVQLLCAALAALWFVAHPLQIQAVTYIVQRMTSLATALALGSLLVWLRGDGRPPMPRRLHRAGALVLFGLACGAKEIACVLPATLWLIRASFDRDFEPRWLRRTALPAIALGLVATSVVLLRTNLLADYEAQPFTLYERLLSAPRVLWLYASWVVWPAPSRLNLLHDVAASKSWFDPATTGLAAVALAVAVGAAVWNARRLRFVAFGVLWFGLHLALETSIPPLALAFEHRLMLPLVGVAIAVPPLLLRAAGGRLAPTLGIGGAICLALLAATVVRNEVWRDPLRLWEDTARKSPEHPIALDELGLALAKAGRLPEARDILTRATTLVPRRAEAFAHLGFVEGLLGETERKRVWLERAIEIDPAYPRAHHALGLTLGQQDPAAGVAALARAVDLAPNLPEFRSDLAAMLARAGRGGDARAEWQTVLAQAPRFVPAHTGLGQLARSEGRDDLARVHWTRAFELDPSATLARNNLAWLRATSDDPEVRDADAAWTLAAPLLEGPPDPEILDTVAAALAAGGRFGEAADLAARAGALALAAEAPDLARDIAARELRYRAQEAAARDE